MLAVFETIAITLWRTKGNIFYLFNFSYIGCSIALGMFLFIRKYKYSRQVFGPAGCFSCLFSIYDPDFFGSWAFFFLPPSQSS